MANFRSVRHLHATGIIVQDKETTLYKDGVMNVGDELLPKWLISPAAPWIAKANPLNISVRLCDRMASCNTWNLPFNIYEQLWNRTYVFTPASWITEIILAHFPVRLCIKTMKISENLSLNMDVRLCHTEISARASLIVQNPAVKMDVGLCNAQNTDNCVFVQSSIHRDAALLRFTMITLVTRHLNVC